MIFTCSTGIGCKWQEWQIGNCSKPCGGGTQINTRSKTGKKADGGNCTGSESTLPESCNIQECPGTYVLLLHDYIY